MVRAHLALAVPPGNRGGDGEEAAALRSASAAIDSCCCCAQEERPPEEEACCCRPATAASILFCATDAGWVRVASICCQSIEGTFDGLRRFCPIPAASSRS